MNDMQWLNEDVGFFSSGYTTRRKKRYFSLREKTSIG